MEPEQQRGVGELQQRNEHPRGGTEKQGIPWSGKRSHWKNEQKVGKTKKGTDKEPKPNNANIKEAKMIRHKKTASYQNIKDNLTEKKQKALTEYTEAPKN